LLEHRDRPLGFLERDVCREAVRIERRPLVRRLRPGGLAVEEVRPLAREPRAAGVVVGVLARVDQGLVEDGSIVSRQASLRIGHRRLHRLESGDDLPAPG
jgi:hypothetical protein